MKRILNLLMLLLLIAANGTAQPSRFAIKRPNIHDLGAIERANHGTEHWSIGKSEFTVPPHYFPNAEKYQMAQPFLSIRNTNPIETDIRYAFSRRDSIVRMVDYNWSGKISYAKDLENIFDSNIKDIDKAFSKTGVTTITKNDVALRKKTVWDDGKTRVEQNLYKGESMAEVTVIISWY